MTAFIPQNSVILAPMIEVNDLPFRMLARKYGNRVCYTGMINANQWNVSKTFKENIFKTCTEDRPLVCQVSGSANSDLLSAAKELSTFCDMIDINLGCCQRVAKRGGYGYYAVDTCEKREDIIENVRKISATISIPLSAKIRVIPDEDGNPSNELTVEFAKALEEAGISLITVHARSATQDKSGQIDTELIKSIVNSVKIPVIANGGIRTIEDKDRILADTGAYAVMAGQALLTNPSCFLPEKASSVQIARDYLEMYAQYGGPFDVARRHFFYFFDEELGKKNHCRGELGQCRTVQDLENFIGKVERNELIEPPPPPPTNPAPSK